MEQSATHRHQHNANSKSYLLTYCLSENRLKPRSLLIPPATPTSSTTARRPRTRAAKRPCGSTPTTELRI